jgi:hypothetical protein
MTFAIVPSDEKLLSIVRGGRQDRVWARTRRDSGDSRTRRRNRPIWRRKDGKKITQINTANQKDATREI